MLVLRSRDLLFRFFLRCLGIRGCCRLLLFCCLVFRVSVRVLKVCFYLFQHSINSSPYYCILVRWQKTTYQPVTVYSWSSNHNWIYGLIPNYITTFHGIPTWGLMSWKQWSIKLSHFTQIQQHWVKQIYYLHIRIPHIPCHQFLSLISWYLKLDQQVQAYLLCYWYRFQI